MTIDRRLVNETRRNEIRTAATLGLALGGPAALVSGLVTLATIPRGVPSVVAAVFLISTAATVISVVLYLTSFVDDG